LGEGGDASHNSHSFRIWETSSSIKLGRCDTQSESRRVSESRGDPPRVATRDRPVSAREIARGRRRDLARGPRREIASDIARLSSRHRTRYRVHSRERPRGAASHAFSGAIAHATSRAASHVKSAAVTEAGSSDEYMPYDWNKVKLKCKVTLSRPLDPWQVSTTRRHLRRHWPFSQRGEHALPSGPDSVLRLWTDTCFTLSFTSGLSRPLNRRVLSYLLHAV
jgi:hypothetical protein